MAKLGDISVSLTLDTKKFDKTLQRVTRDIKKLADNTKQSMQSMTTDIKENTAEQAAAFKDTGDAAKEVSKQFREVTNVISVQRKNIIRLSDSMLDLGIATDETDKIMQNFKGLSSNALASSEVSTLHNQIEALKQEVQALKNAQTQAANDAKKAMKSVSSSSKKLANQMNMSGDSQIAMLNAVNREMNELERNSVAVTDEVANEFSALPPHVQRYVQALKNAGKSTAKFAAMNARYQALHDLRIQMGLVQESSKKLTRTLGIETAAQQRILNAASGEYDRFADSTRYVSIAVKEEFSSLPKHLQAYVQRLKDAGKSTAEFAALNEKYGQRIMQRHRETNEYLQAKTTQSENVMKRLNEIKFSGVTNQLMRLGHSLEEKAKKGDILNVALTRVGENASPEKLRKEMEHIEKGITRMTGAVMGFGIASLGALVGLVLMSNVVDGRLIPAFDELKSTWLDALTPFVHAFTTFAVAVMNGFTAIGKMMKALAETHPQLSQMLWGILALTLAFGVFLAPLAIGIARGQAFAVAFTVAWKAIQSFVLGMLAAGGFALVLAAAVVVVVAVIHNLWNASENLRSAWGNLWKGVANAFKKNFAQPVAKAWEELKTSFSKVISAITGDGGTMADLWTFLGDHIATVVNLLAKVLIPVLSVAFKALGLVVVGIFKAITLVLEMIAPAIEKLSSLGGDLKGAFEVGDFSGILSKYSGLILSIVGIIFGGIPALIIAGVKLASAFAESLGVDLTALIQKGTDMVIKFLEGIVAGLPLVLEAASQVILGFVNGLTVALPAAIEAISGVIIQLLTFFTTAIATYIPMILQAAITILQALVQGIVENLPLIVSMVVMIIDTLILGITELLPLVIDTGIALLTALVDGIVQILPVLIDTVVQGITLLLTSILEFLPELLVAGIELLTALIFGILSVLPQLLEAAVTLVMTLVMAILGMLPQLITTGIELLLTLILGIISMLPELIAAAIKLVIAIITTLIQNLPKIIEAGVKILVALIGGLLKAIPQLLAAVPKIITSLWDAFTEIDWSGLGKAIIDGIASGITKFGGVIADTAKSAASAAYNGVKNFLNINSPSRKFRDGIGQWIPEGIAVGIERKAHVASDAVMEVGEDMYATGNNVRYNSINLPSIEHGGGTDKPTTQDNSTTNFTINATIREDADIQRIIDEIERLKKTKDRALGVFSY